MPLPQLDRAELHNWIRSLMIVRIIVVTSLLVIGVLILDGSELTFELGPIYALIIAGYLLTLIYWILLELRVSYFWLLYTQIVMDVILETGLVYFSGGIYSQYTVLYVLTILTGSIFYQVTGGLIACTLASICYALVIWFESTGKLPPVIINDDDLVPLTGGMIFLRVYLNISFFYLIAFLSGFLSENALRKGQEARKATSELYRIKLNTDDILRNMSSGLVTVDGEGHVVSLNRAAANILGHPYQENYTGRLCTEIFTNHLKEFGEHLIQILNKGVSQKYHELLITPPGMGGVSRPIGIKTTLLTQVDGTKRGVIALFEDLTIQKRMEERIRRSDRLAAVGRLSAGIAHEIRNPLASISGAVQMLKEELELEEDNLRLLNLVVRESDRLNNIISNFLYFSRLEAAKMEDVNLRRLIDDLVFLLKSRSEINKDFSDITYQINISPTITVYADPGQLEQLFMNLCLNAIEAMEHHGEIRIHATLESSEMVAIDVEDTGKGISEEQLERIFDPFYTNRKGGTGLGLAIVSRIVENHHGEIRVESEVNVGTHFFIRLPTSSPTDTTYL